MRISGSTPIHSARSFALITASLFWWLASPPPARAQAIPASAYGAMRWRLVGPHRGGRALAVSGIPGDPTTFYFGAVAGGVWKTENAGLTWEPLFDDEPVASVGALAIAPSDRNTIYVGTGEADMRSDITFGNGVYKSTDGGKTWRHIGLDDTRQIGKILIAPRDPNLVLVAALGHAYGPNAERGVFRSTDGGATWQKVLYKDENTGAIDLAFDPMNPVVVYAALWQARRPPWSQYPPDEGPGGGIYKSTDEGQTWHAVTGGGLPAGQVGRIGLAAARGGQVVYALIESNRDDAGLYRSDDGGTSWRRVSNDARIRERNWYFGQVFVDPTNADIVYVPNRSVMRSTDGGRTFTTIKGSPGGDDYHVAWIDPENDHRIIIGSDQGVIVSVDDGKTWSSWYNQPTAQFYHVITDNRYPYTIYGAQQDAGSVAITSRSDDGEITFRDWYSPGAGESGYLAPDPLDPDIVYGGDTYGIVHRFDRRTGQDQDISPTLLAPFDEPLAQRRYRFTWTSPIVFDPLDPHTLYLGAQFLLRTTDGGLHWDSASPDLTGAKHRRGITNTPITMADAAARGYGVIYTIAPSPVKEGVIWAGTDDGKIQLSTDKGAHWTDVTPAGLAPWSKISLLDASPLDSATAYAAVDRHRLDDIAPYIYRTHDFGRHWTRIDQGIPSGAYVRAVRADPVRTGLLYAGTELGVYVSFDDGDHWQSLQLNLPVVPVHDLVVHDTDLVIATHGRAFWVLDDVTPLRQLTEEVIRSDIHLFRPDVAVRVRRSENQDTPLPPEVPHGENPPAGAIIDYYVKTSPAGPVTLEILDAHGDVVRRFSSAERFTPPKEPPYFMNEWLPRPESLTVHTGLNRFVWNLRYLTPPAETYDYSIAAIAGHGTVAVPEGPLVLPGTYQVRLTAGGQTLTEPLRVVMDPRVHVADAALASQLALALDIWNKMAEANALQADVDALRDSLHALAARRLDAKTTAAASALNQALAALRPGSAGDDMGGVETAVESADREPTQQSRDAFAVLQRRLAAQRSRWNSIIKNELAALNVRLRVRGIASVAPPSIPPERLSAGTR